MSEEDTQISEDDWNAAYGESYRKSLDAMKLAFENIGELPEVPGFVTDYSLRVAQVNATLALVEHVAEVVQVLASAQEIRQDEKFDDTSPLARIAAALERLEVRR